MTPQASLTGLTATELAEAVRNREVSCVELADEYLTVIDDRNPELVAFSAVDRCQVRAQAIELDRLLTNSGPVGPLHGVPIGVKDLIFTRGLRTSGGSSAYADFIPDDDDVAVTRLRSAGALIIGKTNTATFGFGPTTTNPVSGTTVHPVDPTLWPGGSSGGSAVAVASGMCPAALGSDGGGSIRMPASLCGLFGFKPTFGLLPIYPSCRDDRFPGFSAWESLEHIGPMARTSKDLALLLEAMAGLDTRDRHSVPNPIRDFRIVPTQVEGARIAVINTFGSPAPIDPVVLAAVESAARCLARAGAKIETYDWSLKDVGPTLDAIAALEADLEALRKLESDSPNALNDRIRRCIDRQWSFTEVSEAHRQRQHINCVVSSLFRKFDLLVTPCVPVSEIKLTKKHAGSIADPGYLGMFTMPFNLTGSPAATVPLVVPHCHQPIGVQLVADRFEDMLVLSAASVLEHQYVPDLA